MWPCVYIVPHDYIHRTLGSLQNYPRNANRKDLLLMFVTTFTELNGSNIAKSFVFLNEKEIKLKLYSHAETVW